MSNNYCNVCCSKLVGTDTRFCMSCLAKKLQNISMINNNCLVCENPVSQLMVNYGIKKFCDDHLIQYSKGEKFPVFEYNVVMKIEEAHHDGYCSGDSCDYTRKDKKCRIKCFKPPKIGQGYTECIGGASYYCELDSKAIEFNIDRHTRRTTFIKASEITSEKMSV
jgi:hypothetical protein